LDDLINKDNLELIKAAERFDEFKASNSHPSPCDRFVRVFYVCRWTGDSLNKINRSFAELERKFEREPSHDEIAELLELLTPLDWALYSLSQ
jgi:RNA polymerase primary sigma factor